MSNRSNKPQPPGWARLFLAWYCKDSILEDLEGDLNEYFERNCRTKGVRRAKLIYIADVLQFLRRYTIRRPEFINYLIQWIMIGSYIKTSGRNIVRNKLFSGINIIGLAVSMSVALLVITFIAQLRLFDNFHEKKDHTYRIITSTNSMDFATTSVLAGKRIKETIAGIDDLTILRKQFGGDAVTEKSTLPVSGLWADGSFLSVFTFPLLYGDAATALKEPYSIVLTEETAKKLFGITEVTGRSIKFDTINYVVTAVMKDIPKQSHLRFDVLASFSTVELLKPDTDGGFMSWGSCFMSLVYIVLPENADLLNIQKGLDQLCETENKTIENGNISLSLQPIDDIVLGKKLGNQIGPVMNKEAIAVLSGLAFVVIISACFNYTNLSMARSLRRSREVGIRKVIGATKKHVANQFLTESVIISMLALMLAFVFFWFLRDQFISLHPFLSTFGSLSFTPEILAWAVALAVGVGIIAGVVPALFFSNIQAARVLKDVSSMRVFRHVNMRKALIVVQFVFSLMFITATTIGYTQYKNFLTFDLGFSTENIININLQGNKANLITKEIKELPEVNDVSQSLLVLSLGNNYVQKFKYEKTSDSSAVWMNFVDEHYLPLHQYTFLAGKNFKGRTENVQESEAIVNERLLKRFNIGTSQPEKAIGEEVIVDGKRLTIVGVVKDFHYETLEDNIEPSVFRHFTNADYGYLNVKVSSNDWTATLHALEKAWKKVDKIHPLQANFYNDQLENAYSAYSMMLKVIGFLGFLTICISSMGLFGMVVFTTETKMKEMSIRKVLGASERKLIFLLSKGFLVLIAIAAAVAIPLTCLFFSAVVLSNVAYHKPIGLAEIGISVSIVAGIAFLMIGAQTLKAARTNPAEVLKNE